MAPSPERYHQDILGNLYVLLRNYLDKQSLGSVHLAPSDVCLSDINVFEPDLYYVSKARKTILTKQGATGAPDLVVEILSPKTAKLDRGIKREVYARCGVAEMWILEPLAKRLSVYRFAGSTNSPVEIHEGRKKFASPLFPGLKINLEKVFEQ